MCVCPNKRYTLVYTKCTDIHHAGNTSIIYLYTVTTFKYVEGGPDRQAPEVV